jgi:hypothetical protein
MRSPRPFGELRLAEHDGASLLQAADDGGGIVGPKASREESACARPRALHRAEVLYGNRRAVQRTQRFTFGAAGVGGCRIFTGAVSADFGVGMQLGIKRRNACEVMLGDLARGERPITHLRDDRCQWLVMQRCRHVTFSRSDFRL